MAKNISIIGVPMDLGQNRRGVDMGPSAIRYAGVIDMLNQLNYTVKDLEDIIISYHGDELDAENKLHNLTQVASVNEKLAQMIEHEVAQGHFPLVVGGDHCIEIVIISGFARHYN